MIKIGQLLMLKLTSHDILHYLRSADQSNFVNIYLFSVFFSIAFVNTYLLTIFFK